MLFSRSIKTLDGASLPDKKSGDPKDPDVDADADVRGFVTKTWLVNYESQFFRDNPEYDKSGRGPYDPEQKKLYYRKYHPVITELINRSVIYLAVYPEDPTMFMGFVVGDKHNPTIHYLYIRKENRRDGIAKELVNRYQIEFKGCELPKTGALWTFTHTPSKKPFRRYLDEYTKKYDWHKIEDPNKFLSDRTKIG